MSTAEATGFRKWAPLLVLSLALAIIVIDTTILNVSLATIIREFKTTIQNIQWVITAYSLTLAALTITGGRLGDFFGRKRMFVVGALIFALGSFICSISHNVPTMIMGESIIEGIGAALMMPATSSLLVSMYHGRDRSVAFGVWGGVAAAAAAIGPLLGGYLTTHFSWRWAFRINVGVALILLLGSFIIAEVRDMEEKAELDWFGVILSAVGLLSLVFGFIEASTYGWFFAKDTFTVGSYAFHSIWNLSIVPYALVLGAVLLGAFVAWEKRVEAKGHTPLVSTALFANKQFTSGSITTAVMSLGMSGLFFILPVFLQGVKNLDAFHTGLALLPMSLVILVFAPLSGFLSTKINPKMLILIGLFLNALGALVLRQSLHTDMSTWQIFPGLMVFGAGLGMVMAQVSNISLSAVSVEQAGEASGVNSTLRQVGSTLGSAIIGAVLLSALATNLNTGVLNSKVIPEPAKQTIATAVSKQASNVEFEGGAQVSQGISPVIQTELHKIGLDATTNADRLALLWAAFFGLLGFLTAFNLPNIKPSQHGKSAATPASGH